MKTLTQKLYIMLAQFGSSIFSDYDTEDFESRDRYVEEIKQTFLDLIGKDEHMDGEITLKGFKPVTPVMQVRNELRAELREKIKVTPLI